MITLKKIKQIIDQNFKEPFLDDGFVITSFSKNKKELNITIGRRDITINEKGEVTSSGTSLC